MGWGEKTITRYENDAIQDKSHDTILKSIIDYDGFISPLILPPINVISMLKNEKTYK